MELQLLSRGADAFSRGMIVVASAGNEGGTSNPHIGASRCGICTCNGAVNSSETKLLSVQLGLMTEE
jgi:hypothetical protein